MNSFGQIFNVQIMGESHGPVVGITINGCPPGIDIAPLDFEQDLNRRKGGHQKGTTPRQEADIPHLLSGIFNGKSTGMPIHIQFANENIRSSDYNLQRSIPRPSHADFVAHHKYKGYEDYRGGGHFSARLTTGIVAAGVIAKKLLPNIKIEAYVSAVGGNTDIEAGLEAAIQRKDSVGARIKCIITGVPLGLGAPYFDSLESSLAHLMFAIPAVRGIEFGTGFQAANMYGLEHNDSIIDKNGTTKTNHAGGIVGGISNGNPITFEIAVKPTASTPQEQSSYNWDSDEIENFSIKGRHDLCVGLRAPVIVEAAAAIVLADHMLRYHAQQYNPSIQ